MVSWSALCTLIAGLGLSTAAWGGEESGWRGDGSGVWPGARLVMPSEAREVWRVETADWGNASPVLLGDLVCMTQEPTTIRCVRQSDGAGGWIAASDYVTTLSGQARADWEAKLKRLPALEGELDEARKALSRLRREARRGGGEDAAAQLGDASARLDTLRAEHEAMRPHLTPADKDLIGYASPTPAVRDGTLWALFGNGVVSSFDQAGARRWSVYLGTASPRMRGFDFGTTTSPVVVGDVVLVAHGTLTALDAATGAVRWKDDRPWDHYGALAPLNVEGVDVVATPGGRVLRVSDGREMARDLGEVWFGGALAADGALYWIGGKGRADQAGNFVAKAYDVRGGGDELVVEERWSVPFPVAERVYMTPLRDGGRLYVATHDRKVVVLREDSGEVVNIIEPPEGHGVAYQGVIAVGQSLVVMDDRGGLYTVDRQSPSAPTGAGSLDTTSRSTPIFQRNRMFVRTLSALIAYE